MLVAELDAIIQHFNVYDDDVSHSPWQIFA